MPFIEYVTIKVKCPKCERIGNIYVTSLAGDGLTRCEPGAGGCGERFKYKWEVKVVVTTKTSSKEIE